jgi:hypothetical protein
VQWDQTALGANFLRYELERLGKDGVTWQMIAWSLTEAVNRFIDLEARMGILESYRVSVRQTNGVVSPPSTVATGTASIQDTVLAANEVQLTSIVSLDRPADLATARDRTVSSRFGKRYPSVFELPQDRGVTLSTTSLLSATTGVINNYQTIRTMLDANPTQWAVLFDTGERFWVRPVADAAHYQLTSATVADMSFIECNDEPAIALVS